MAHDHTVSSERREEPQGVWLERGSERIQSLPSRPQAHLCCPEWAGSVASVTHVLGAEPGWGATSTPCRWPPTFLNGPRTVFRRAIPKSTLRCAWPSPPLSTQISALMCCPQGRGAFFKTAKGLTPGSERPAQVQASSNRSAVPREGDVAADSGTSMRLCHGDARAGLAPFVHRAPFLDLHVSRP